MAYTRELTFLAESLGKAADLVLTLGEPEDDLRFPVVCKAFHFGPIGIHKANFTFKSQFAFFCGLNEGGVVVPTTWVAIALGQKVKLVQEGGSDFFTPPEEGSPGRLTAVNDTGRVVGLGLGFITDSGTVVPVYFWPSVMNGQTVVVDPPSILRGYVTSEYKEGQVVRSEMGSPPVLNANLPELPEHTFWNLFYNPITGTFELRLK